MLEQKENPLDRFIHDSSSSKKDDIKQILGELFNKLGMNQKSVLNAQQVHAIAVLSLYAEKYDSNTARDLASLLLELCISLNGRGRGDLVKALNTALIASDEAQTETRRKILGI